MIRQKTIQEKMGEEKKIEILNLLGIDLKAGVVKIKINKDKIYQAHLNLK